MFSLVRTDPNARKRQEGISFLLVDMKTPGITVRPIISIDGSHHLNEVFFDDVRVPVAMRVMPRTKAGMSRNSCSATNAPASPGWANRASGSASAVAMAREVNFGGSR